MKKKLVLLYIVLVHVFFLMLLIKSDVIDRIQHKIGFIDKGPELSKHYYKMLEHHSRMDGNIPDSAIVFIGDSITQSLAVSAITPLGVNYGIGNDTTTGVMKRISSYDSINRAKIVVIAIGINDLRWRGTEETINNYKKILGMIPSKLQIIVNALHPVNENYNKLNGYNKTIDNFNEKLRILCSDYTNIYYLNVSPLLKDSMGNLSNDYHVGDGLHLSTAGYNIWINKLREIIEKRTENNG